MWRYVPVLRGTGGDALRRRPGAAGGASCRVRRSVRIGDAMGDALAAVRAGVHPVFGIPCLRGIRRVPVVG
ncbi:hypothetical protein BSLA_02f1049 [Burkholderia stabilis]|nr:hypothetical protein BSLA_02f1049 [Burkholderia stabilis]